jgi:hypothetical protein
MDEQCGTVPKKLHWPPPPPPPWADVAGPVSHVVLNALMGARGM